MFKSQLRQLRNLAFCLSRLLLFLAGRWCSKDGEWRQGWLSVAVYVEPLPVRDLLGNTPAGTRGLERYFFTLKALTRRWVVFDLAGVEAIVCGAQGM